MSKSKLKIYTFKSLITKRQLRIRYLNCLLQFDFAHVVKFYSDNFTHVNHFTNNVVEFKKQLNVFYAENKASSCTFFFADKLNLSTNYFGIW
jgi:hypothetical protein